jgi:hypothetical protein
MSSSQPIFIIGNPRSGTTLLRLMVASHPAIVVPPECGFAVWWREKYQGWNADSATDRVEEFLRDLAQSKKIETWQMDFKAVADAIRSEKPANYAALVSLAYSVYARQHKPAFRRWGDKNNFHVRHVATLYALFPGAQFIHIVRDGRDAACSYRQLSEKKIESAYAPKLPVAIDSIAAEWKDNLEAVRAGFATLPKDQRAEVRYEDLVHEPENTLRSLCEFLGETFDAKMLEYYSLNRRDTLEPTEFLQWKSKTLNPPDVAGIGRFRAELTAAEIETFEKIAGEMLRAYNYL